MAALLRRRIDQMDDKVPNSWQQRLGAIYHLAQFRERPDLTTLLLRIALGSQGDFPPSPHSNSPKGLNFHVEFLDLHNTS